MICPQCGKWNRSSLPRCTGCGAVLPEPTEEEIRKWLSDRDDLGPASSVIYKVEKDNSTTRPDIDGRDDLADEMRDLRERRLRGSIRKERFMRETAQSDYTTNTSDVYTTPPEEYSGPENDANAPIDYTVSYSHYRSQNSGHGNPDIHYPGNTSRLTTVKRSSRRSYRPVRPPRPSGFKRFFPYLSILLIVGILAAAGYFFFYLPNTPKQVLTFADQVEIIPSMYNDMAAHTVRIPAPEGSRIYIRELHGSASYISVADESGNAYADVTIADYTWYELEKNITDETMDVTLTPYIRSASGELTMLGTITYTIDIPLSPLTLVSPDTSYLEVTSSPYTIQFRVEQNSTVTINGVDYSSFVNTQDGLISYNAPVQAIGENIFEIVVNCQSYRENRVTVTLYREPQDIPLELGATLGNTSSSTLMTITGTTVPGATITVLTPYEDLDTSNLKTTGAFSFKAVFSTIGTNNITIVAEKDGHTATLTKSVYYVPYASTYTPKAWAMDSSAAGVSNYADYLNNTATRVANTQIYVCVGTITEILSNKPQLALMDTDDSDTGERLVLLENMSGDTWVVGQRYRVYADAFGIYNGKPRLIGRYTYAPLN